MRYWLWIIIAFVLFWLYSIFACTPVLWSRDPLKQAISCGHTIWTLNLIDENKPLDQIDELTNLVLTTGSFSNEQKFGVLLELLRHGYIQEQTLKNLYSFSPWLAHVYEHTFIPHQKYAQRFRIQRSFI